MATTFYRDKTTNSILNLISFYGGEKEGKSLQITLLDGSVFGASSHVLNKKSAQKLRNELNRWIDGDYLKDLP